MNKLIVINYTQRVRIDLFSLIIQEQVQRKLCIFIYFH